MLKMVASNSVIYSHWYLLSIFQDFLLATWLCIKPEPISYDIQIFMKNDKASYYQLTLCKCAHCCLENGQRSYRVIHSSQNN